MKLTSLTMTNFMPYKSAVRVEFPQDPQHNVMIVYGDNMRGKTSLLNAVRWAFYGRALGRHLREIPLHQLLNTDAAAEQDWTLEVHVRFDVDGHTYDLRRRAQKKPLIAQPTRPEDFEVTVGLQKDGMALRSDVIESEINQIAPQQISRFFLFDGELLQEYETLLIEGSEQGKRIKDAIEQVLGVPALTNGRDEIATILRSAQRQQSRELSHVAGLERQAEQQALLQEKQQSLEDDQNRLREKATNARNERIQLDDELEAVDRIHQAKLRLDFLEKRQEEIVQDQKDKRAERLTFVKDAWRDLLDAKLSLRRRELMAEHRRLTQQIEERSALTTRIRQLRKLLETAICPICGQGMHDSRRAAIGNDLGALEGQLRGMTTGSEALSRVAAEMQALDRLKGGGVGPKIRGIDADLRRLDVELTQVENEIEDLRKEIRGYDTAEISRKRAFRDQLIREEARLDKDIQDVQTQLDGIKNQLAIIAKTLRGQAASRASRSTAIVNLALSLEKAFSDSIERLRDSLRKQVEALSTEAFCEMTTQEKYTALEINSNYGLQIIDEKRQRVPVRSAGAEQVVALSLIDGLSRTGQAAGPIIMDTPFGRLDPHHRENILRYLPQTTSQLILLVHEGEVRRDTDLTALNARIATIYEIKEINPRQSRIERVSG